MPSSPKVSVVSITYNQEKYIREALESFVAQKTNFAFDVVIADDCSTDSTPSIIEEYAKKYPHIIKSILRSKNIGVQKNLLDTIRSATGKYIALCEGDDYWTDTAKLQMQVDFLDSHPDYALCFHAVRVFYENDVEPEYIFPDSNDRSKFTTQELMKGNFIQTNSVMYRRQSYDLLPTDDIMPLDWYFHLYHASFGKIGYIDKVMSVYRRHPGGIWWASANRPEIMWKKYGLAHVAFYNEVRKIYVDKAKYQKALITAITMMFNSLLEMNKRLDTQLLQRTLHKFPELSAIFVSGEHLAYIDALNTAEEDRRINARVIQEKNLALEATRQEIGNLQEEKMILEQQLDQIIKSKTYKAAQKVVAPYRKIKAATRPKRVTK